jgi:hypothetical protein
MVVDDNLYALVISGTPNDEELQAAWLQIQGEYADAISDSEHRMYVSLFKEITILATNLQLIEYAVEILEQVYSKELADRLNKLLNTSFQFDPADPVKYKATLKNCLMRSKSIKINLDLKQIQMQGMQDKMKEPGKKATREYFQSILITLSNHVKYQLSESITVFEFCDRLKRYNKECEEITRQTKRRARG